MNVSDLRSSKMQLVEQVRTLSDFQSYFMNKVAVLDGNFAILVNLME